MSKRSYNVQFRRIICLTEPPLVGAEVIGGLPEGVSFEIEECARFELGQLMTNGLELGQLMTNGDDKWMMTNGEGGIQVSVALVKHALDHRCTENHRCTERGVTGVS